MIEVRSVANVFPSFEPRDLSVLFVDFIIEHRQPTHGIDSLRLEASITDSPHSLLDKNGVEKIEREANDRKMKESASLASDRYGALAFYSRRQSEKRARCNLCLHNVSTSC